MQRQSTPLNGEGQRFRIAFDQRKDHVEIDRNGIFSRFDPAHGFLPNADRLGQLALHQPQR
jgi:hypothetical protein